MSFVAKILIEEISIYNVIHARQEFLDFTVHDTNVTLTIFQKSTELQMFDTGR